MTIGELARATGCGIETIRYYEHEGLLPKPGRTNGNFRRYGQEHAELLSFIRHCRALDMALNEIRILLRFRSAPYENCGEVNALLDTHIYHVEERIAELQSLEGQLRALRDKCSSGDRRRTVGFCRDLVAPPMTRTRPAKIMFRVRIRPNDSAASS
jgi:Cd(II)/Pb(II)-responsive transcriptional regulator